MDTKKLYIMPLCEVFRLDYQGIIALSTSEDDDERGPQSVKDRDPFEEELWDTSKENLLW